MNCSDTHCMYKNLWYNNGRFYLLVDGKEPVVSTYLPHWQHMPHARRGILNNLCNLVFSLKWCAPVTQMRNAQHLIGMTAWLQKGWDMTRNQKLHVLHVDSAPSFANSQTLQYVRGDTLLFDFVYFLHPVGSPSASIQDSSLVRMAHSRVLKL